tara:strand:- start:1544 stop:1918 length:375 start_codon:yes stop_codon:yes gene_type:complete
MSFSLSLYTYLSPSKVCDGVGVFSLVHIPADTLIFKSKNAQKIRWGEVPEEVRGAMRNLTYYDKDGFWVDDDLDRLGAQYYINHSLTPNVSYNKDNGCLYATRDIKPHEELLDYYYPNEREWLT